MLRKINLLFSEMRFAANKLFIPSSMFLMHLEKYAILSSIEKLILHGI